MQVSVAGNVSIADVNEIRSVLPHDLATLITHDNSSLGAIDLPIVITFVLSAIGGGVIYDVLKNAVLSLKRYRDTNKSSKEVIIEIRSPNGSLHISEFETYVSERGQAERTSCSVVDGLKIILNSVETED